MIEGGNRVPRFEINGANNISMMTEVRGGRGGEKGGVNEIVRREEEEAVALDVEGGESQGLGVGIKLKRERDLREKLQVLHLRSNPKT